MLSFEENRRYIENEFEMAAFDEATGLSVGALREYLQGVQAAETDMPRQLVCANAYAYLLDHAQLEINAHTPFAVKFNIGIDYREFATTSVFEEELFQKQRIKLVSEKFPEEYKIMRSDGVSCGTWTDFWHTVPDWNNILSLGFPGILAKAEETKEKFRNCAEDNQKQLVFLDSVIICYRAILRFLERVYQYSLQFDVPEFSQCICNLSRRAPQTLYEVMQLSVLFLYFEEAGCERARTLGDIDRLYLPYYERDLKDGVPRETLDDLFRYFFMHFTAAKRFAEQPFTLGGCNQDGTDRSNALTLRILEIYDGLKIYDPKIHIRYHKNLNKGVLKKAVSMIRGGNSSICIMNDHVVFAGYERLGIGIEDAQNYVVLGCYEPIIMGLEEGEVGAAWLNMVKAVEFAINGGRDILTGRQSGIATQTELATFEDFLDVFFKQLDHCIDFTVDFAQKQGWYSTQINPSPIYSSTFSACLEKGMDVHEYPLKYNNMAIKPFGMATVVDSLTAIKKFVYDQKALTLAQLRQALAANWEDYDELRQKIWTDKDKYGNNRQLPDSIFVRVTEHLKNKYCGMQLERGGRLRLGLDSIDYCWYMGSATSATPDGRLARVAVSKNLTATDGKDMNGITAYMQSFLKMDTSAFVNGAPLDFVLHPSAIEGEKGLQDFISLIEVFFAHGGFALQGNIFNKEMLVEAQKNPEKYATLQVRVCGWNEYFVKLDKERQDAFIKRCEVLNQ